MRIAIVSDIHGNIIGLEAVLREIESTGVDMIVQGGDLALNGARPAEVVDLVRARGWQGIMGNVDEALWKLPPGLPGFVTAAFERRAAATRELLGQERLDWMRTLPMEWRGDGVALVHAAPGDLWKAIGKGAPDAKLREVYGPLGSPLAVCGHIHQPYVREMGDLTVANSGSAGAPYDGDTRASYLLVEDGRASVRRVEYDVDAAARELRGSRYPDAEDIAQALLTATFRPPGMPRWLGVIARLLRRR